MRARRPAGDTRPKWTHDDCRWLNEEDGEEDVPGDGRDGYRCDRSPTVAEDQRRRGHRNNDTGPKNGARNHRDEGGRRLIRPLSFRDRAACICLRLRDDQVGPRGLTAPVHGAVLVGAAGHPSLGRGRPAGAESQVASCHEGNDGDGDQAAAASQHRGRMLDPASSVNWAQSKASGSKNRRTGVLGPLTVGDLASIVVLVAGQRSCLVPIGASHGRRVRRDRVSRCAPELYPPPSHSP